MYFSSQLVACPSAVPLLLVFGDLPGGHGHPPPPRGHHCEHHPGSRDSPGSWATLHLHVDIIVNTIQVAIDSPGSWTLS
jgi:hypothetical protein